MRAFQPLFQALAASFMLAGAVSAQAQAQAKPENGLPAADQAVLDRMIGNTVLFVNDTDKIPQVEYLAEDGRGWVWTASFRDEVVPMEWAVPGLQDGKAVFCFQFAAEDVGLPQDLRLCDFVQKIGAGILDEAEGDAFNLSGQPTRNMELPFDIQSLDTIASERVDP